MPELSQPVTWTDFSRLRWTKRETVSSKLGKIRFEQFLEEHNFPRSRIIKEFQDPDDLDFTLLPEFFVLKPAALWSSRGVMLLRTIDSDLFLDDMSGKTLTQGDIVATLNRLKSNLNISKLNLIAEERAIDEDDGIAIPFDYKLFSFYGRVEFILQVDRNHKTPKMCFFDGEFEPITDDRVFFPEGREDSIGQHRKPKCSSQLIALAKDLSVRLKAPFVSIDCYATKSGAIFGELTHTPGGPWFGKMYRFSQEFDTKLGTAWHDALARLGRTTQLVENSYDIRHNGKVVRTVSR